MAPTVTATHATEAQTDTTAGQRISTFAAGVVLPIAAVTAVLHCIAAAFGDGYWFDEVYMLAIGRYHLDWGSADQPPLAPAFAALADAVAPGSLIALYFADVRRVGDVGEEMHAYLLTGQRQSWNEIWPQLRSLKVS